MPSTYPATPDDLNAAGLDHGDVTDALTAVQATLGVNPQGAAATVAARLAGIWGGRVLIARHAPYDALGDPGPSRPTDGDWVWSDMSEAWFSPAYEVSWQVGDNVAAVPYIPGVGYCVVQPSVQVGEGPWQSDQVGASGSVPQFDLNGSNAPDGVHTTATEAGSGVIFLLTTEEGFGGPTAPPRPTLDVLDYLGDCVLTNGTTPVPWARDEGTGADGDVYIDRDLKILYGPREDGQWGGPINLSEPSDGLNIDVHSDIPIYMGYAYFEGVADLIALYNGASQLAFRVTATGDVYALGGVVLTSPDGTHWRQVISNTGVVSYVAV